MLWYPRIQRLTIFTVSHYTSLIQSRLPIRPLESSGKKPRETTAARAKEAESSHLLGKRTVTYPSSPRLGEE